MNLYGEIVGINTAIASNSGGNEGIGFSIPINLVKTVINRILENGKVERGFLGVILQESSQFEPERAAELGLDRSRGALIVRVSPESPASRADLRPDDVVLKFNDTEIEDQAHLILLVSLAGVGQKATLEIWRDRQSKLVDVVLGDREALQPQVRAYGDNPIERLESLRRAGEQTRIESLGLEVIPLTSDTRAELDYPEASNGLLVTEVDPRGPVGYRIQPLDLIDQVEREPITRAGDLEGAVRKYFLEEGMVVRIRRRVGDEEIVKRLILRPKVK